MGNEQAGGAEVWAASPERARRKRDAMERARGAARQGTGAGQGGGVAAAVEADSSGGARAAAPAPAMNPLLMTARTMQAAKGRQLFSDFQDAQADYARKWGEERGLQGIAELFEQEAPSLAAKYEIVEAMACGVTAVVCKALAVDTGVPVAVKFVRIRVQGLSDGIRRQDCREEARLQRLCDHENVVKLLDFEMGNTFALYVLEFVESTLLQKIVERNSAVSYSERTAAGYIRDVASALRQCHAHNIVHMDVKLDNILCTAGNCAKLCDFGVAEQMQYSDTPIHRNVAAPLFAPPEVHTAGYCTTKADLWSLGICLYIMLCFYPPFKESELQQRIVQARYVFPEREWAQVSIMARDLISRLLVIDVSRRLTAAQVLEHPWVRAAGSAQPQLQPASSPRPPPQHQHQHQHQHQSSPPPPPEAATAAVVAAAASATSASAGVPATPEVPASTQQPTQQKQKQKSAADKNAGASADVAQQHKDKEGAGEELPSDSPVTSPDKGSFVPLPMRVTHFLRNMHHYRELEKKGFENVPGGLLYRSILDGVDEITVGITKNKEGKAGGMDSPIGGELQPQQRLTFAQRINLTLRLARPYADSNALGAVGQPAATAVAKPSGEAAATAATGECDSKFFPKLVSAFENYYYPDDNDNNQQGQQISPRSADSDGGAAAVAALSGAGVASLDGSATPSLTAATRAVPPSPRSGSSLAPQLTSAGRTPKDIVAQAKLQRRESSFLERPPEEDETDSKGAARTTATAGDGDDASSTSATGRLTPTPGSTPASAANSAPSSRPGSANSTPSAPAAHAALGKTLHPSLAALSAQKLAGSAQSSSSAPPAERPASSSPFSSLNPSPKPSPATVPNVSSSRSSDEVPPVTRLRREMSFDVAPEAAPMWIEDECCCEDCCCCDRCAAKAASNAKLVLAL